MIGGRFAPLTIMSNDDTDIDSMITTFNSAVLETASEILGKHRLKKKKNNPGSLHKFFFLCDKRKELRKKRFQCEGSEKYKEVNNNIKSCMEKAKANWIEENSVVRLKKIFRKNNSKRAYQLVKTCPL